MEETVEINVEMDDSDSQTESDSDGESGVDTDSGVDTSGSDGSDEETSSSTGRVASDRRKKKKKKRKVLHPSRYCLKRRIQYLSYLNMPIGPSRVEMDVIYVKFREIPMRYVLLCSGISRMLTSVDRLERLVPIKYRFDERRKNFMVKIKKKKLLSFCQGKYKIKRRLMNIKRPSEKVVFFVSMGFLLNKILPVRSIKPKDYENDAIIRSLKIMNDLAFRHPVIKNISRLSNDSISSWKRTEIMKDTERYFEENKVQSDDMQALFSFYSNVDHDFDFFADCILNKFSKKKKKGFRKKLVEFIFGKNKDMFKNQLLTTLQHKVGIKKSSKIWAGVDIKGLFNRASSIFEYKRALRLILEKEYGYSEIVDDEGGVEAVEVNIHKFFQNLSETHDKTNASTPVEVMMIDDDLNYGLQELIRGVVTNFKEKIIVANFDAASEGYTLANVSCPNPCWDNCVMRKGEHSCRDTNNLFVTNLFNGKDNRDNVLKYLTPMFRKLSLYVPLVKLVILSLLHGKSNNQTRFWGVIAELFEENIAFLERNLSSVTKTTVRYKFFASTLEKGFISGRKTVKGFKFRRIDAECDKILACDFADLVADCLFADTEEENTKMKGICEKWFNALKFFHIFERAELGQRGTMYSNEKALEVEKSTRNVVYGSFYASQNVPFYLHSVLSGHCRLQLNYLESLKLCPKDVAMGMRERLISDIKKIPVWSNVISGRKKEAEQTFYSPNTLGAKLMHRVMECALKKSSDDEYSYFEAMTDSGPLLEAFKEKNEQNKESYKSKDLKKKKTKKIVFSKY